MPRMLCDIISSTLSGEPDMDVIGEPRDGVDVVRAASHMRVDVLVMGLADSELPGDCVRLFKVQPRIRVLGVAGDGRRVFLYELRPQRTPLGELSPQELVDVVRAAARSTIS
jgi:DNA-binding NarL/FixJ family response regulator